MRLALILLALLLGPAVAHARSVVKSADTGTTGTLASKPESVLLAARDEWWLPWPFVRVAESSDEELVGVQPFFTTKHSSATGASSTHVLWPLVRVDYQPQTFASRDRKTVGVFPLWHSATSTKSDGDRVSHRYLIPFYWQGKQPARNGRYLIVFPFIWYAENAKLVTPLFPYRPQTFAAVWPVAGTFRGFWNWDQIRFALWPLFVQSTRGEGADRERLTSVVWPITGLYTGEKIGGFRLWPLVSRVHREGATPNAGSTRAYWLWPLGHYKSDARRDEAGNPESSTWFVPFYVRAREPNFDFDMVFPAYGRLGTRGRETRGYALAVYNEDDNLRTGIRNHRLLWFLVRWTTRIPVDPKFVYDEPTAASTAVGKDEDQPMEGGGLFPIYLRRSNDTRYRLTVLWPLVSRRVDKDPDETFSRFYAMPFYATQKKLTPQRELKTERTFFWPFYRTWQHPDGERYSSAPHLFWYSEAEPLDRNWAPLWTFWSRRQNAKTGESHVGVLGGVWQNDRNADGSARKRFDVFFLHSESGRDAEGRAEGDTQLLWGLVGKRTEAGASRWKLLWIPL